MSRTHTHTFQRDRVKESETQTASESSPHGVFWAVKVNFPMLEPFFAWLMNITS